MLQAKAMTGTVFLLAIALNSWQLAAGALLGTSVSLIAAYLLQCKRSDIEQGLYGFNGGLVGIALVFFYGPNFTVFSLIVLGAFFSSLLMQIMLKASKTRKWALPPYTAPFVISTWMMLAVANTLSIASGINNSHIIAPNEFFSLMLGISQVMFQDYWLSGLLFIVGIALSSWRAALWAVLGSALSLGFALLLEFPEHIVAQGLYGFNAVLVAIAAATRFSNTCLIPLSGILISVIISHMFQHFELPSLTAPFVLTMYLLIVLEKLSALYMQTHTEQS